MIICVIGYNLFASDRVYDVRAWVSSGICDSIWIDDWRLGIGRLRIASLEVAASPNRRTIWSAGTGKRVRAGRTPAHTSFLGACRGMVWASQRNFRGSRAGDAGSTSACGSHSGRAEEWFGHRREITWGSIPRRGCRKNTCPYSFFREACRGMVWASQKILRGNCPIDRDVPPEAHYDGNDN